MKEESAATCARRNPDRARIRERLPFPSTFIPTGHVSSADGSELEIVVILVRTDPKPIILVIPFASEGPITAPDFYRVNATLLFKAQRSVSRIRFE